MAIIWETWQGQAIRTSAECGETNRDDPHCMIYVAALHSVSSLLKNFAVQQTGALNRNIIAALLIGLPPGFVSQAPLSAPGAESHLVLGALHGLLVRVPDMHGMTVVCIYAMCSEVQDRTNASSDTPQHEHG